ncbi:zonadhesin-like isoform X2 [Lucilia sericata]|uniref:zonadhesin-like isoform X2 n=1 Tax=Lucilia sericata TaxID=13632 RepID=UPI0018A84899|nr:zonadhesin-like isoform X2 [Lucilia sericata]
MIIRNYLLIGFAIFALEINLCEAVDVPCPNAPVTPYPIVQPVPINTTNNPCPVTPCQSSGCVIQQTCCPCSQPCQTLNNCAYPTNCSNTPGCGSTTPCVGSTIPCVGLSPPCVNTTTPNCQTPPTTVTNPPPTTLPPPPPETTRPYEPPITTHPPPPAPIIKCPPGTILIGQECHLLYCPRGSQMENGRCIIIECPDGTVWTGHRCSVPEPIVQNLTFNYNFITKFNQTKPDIVLNNVNNIVVNASMTIHDEFNNNNECNHDYGDCEEEISTETTATQPPPSSTKCCIVKTPRMCEQRNNRWQCYSRRSRKCGDFCVAPIIYLQPPSIYSRPQYLVMPPMQYDCQMQGNCGPIGGGYDCSGCAINNMSRCSPYCYRYSCPSHRCDFYDQQKYCAYNLGSYGCQQQDGCFDHWCQ